MRRTLLAIAGCIACSSNGSPQQGDTGNGDSQGVDDGAPVTTGGPAPATTSGAPSDTGGALASTGAGETTGAPPIKLDVGGVGHTDTCESLADGAYCANSTRFVCGDGKTTELEDCDPGFCVDGACVVCLEGQFDCAGALVMECNTNATPPRWQQVEECNPQANQGCDVGLGACADIAPVGSTVPTGTYYKYADFQVGGGAFMGGCDVDTFENRIYVSGGLNQNWINQIHVYEVELLDSDGDGHAEPDQHPDNPDETGPVEERMLTFIESIPVPANTMYLQGSEIYAYEDRLIYVGGNMIELDLETHETTVIRPAPTWATGAISEYPNGAVSFVGYDEIHDLWYAGNESARRVFQYSPAQDSWGLAFAYPEFGGLGSGAHPDGLEVVTDPETQIAYVYVSDMTSDFIGQYRIDPEMGWVQENLFAYADNSAADVEGLGFGALGHFWVSSLSGHLAEIGGGSLSEYLPPAPTG